MTVEGNIPAPDDGREYLPRTLVPVSPETLPSAASVLTGLFPPQHGLRVDGVGRLADDTPTLATRLRERGYETAAFLSSVALAPTHGLERGFSVYDVAIAPSNTATRFLRTADEIVDAALAYLDGPQTPDPAKPCFLWLHLSPYAGSTHTNTAAAAQASAALARLTPRFAKDAQILIVPLFGLGLDVDFRGLTLADPELPSRAFLSGAKAVPLGVAEIPFAAGLEETPPPGRYTESLVPWYAFRLPPLEARQGDGVSTLSVLQGLAPVRPLPLAHQSAALILRANGHLGEGLVPPYTNGAARAALTTDDFARINRARTAMLALRQNATNRTALLKNLVETDPEVPLFYQWLGESLLLDRDITSACNAFQKASEYGYNMVLANRLQSQCHAMIGNVPAAIERAETAFMLNADDPLTRRELSRLLLRTGAALIQNRDFKTAESFFAFFNGFCNVAVQGVRPFAAAYNISCRQQQSANHQFLYRVCVCAGGIENGYAFFGHARNGNIVDAGAGSAYRQQVVADLVIVHLKRPDQNSVGIFSIRRYRIVVVKDGKYLIADSV